MAAKKILTQFDVQAVTSLSNPGAGYVGFSAKTDGLYQKIGAGSDLRLLTSSDGATYVTGTPWTAMGYLTALPAHTLDSHSNVTMTSKATNDILKWNGTAWINTPIPISGKFTDDTYGITYTGGNVGIGVGAHQHFKLYLNGSLSVGGNEIQHVSSIAFNTGLGIGSFSAGYGTLYAKTSTDHLYYRNSVGTEFDLTGTPWTSMGYVTGTPWTSMGYVTGTPWTSYGYLTSQISHADVVVDGDFTSNGLMTRTGAGTYSITATSAYSLAAHTHAGVYQPLDNDLTAIAGLTGVLGFLKKTNTDTWTLDTSTYALSTHTHAGAYAALEGNAAQSFNVANLNASGSIYGQYITVDFNILAGNNISSSTYNLGSATPDTLIYIDLNKYVKSLPTASYPNLTEIAYVKGVTSAIQTQLNGKAALAGSLTQAFNASQITLEAGTYDWTIAQSGGNLNFAQYTTSFLFNGSGIICSPATASTIAHFDANKTLSSLPIASYPSLTELSYIKGVTSAIQTQLNGKAALNGSGSQTFSASTLTAASVTITTGAAAGKILTSNADGNATWETPGAVTVPAASETVSGTVEIATTAEVQAMSDMLRSLTPYTLANAFPNSSGNNGYISIPIGFGARMLIQYGSFSANGNGTCSFPIAFPLYCYSVVISAGDGIARIPSKTRFSFVWQDVQDAITSAVPCNWIAIGK